MGKCQEVLRDYLKSKGLNKELRALDKGGRSKAIGNPCVNVSEECPGAQNIEFSWNHE